MNIIVFGASGKVGSLVVKELLKRGHNVTGFVYGKNPFKDEKNLKIISGDIKSADDVMQAVKGQDAVISTLGSWGTKTKDILSSGMKNIIPAMEKNKVTRIISLTGADARDVDDNPNIINDLTHMFFGLIAGKIMKDGEDHIKQLRNSRLDWTIIRSPVMKNTGEFGNYKLSNKLPMPWQSINRKDLVLSMVDQIENTDYIKSSPVVWTK